MRWKGTWFLVGEVAPVLFKGASKTACCCQRMSHSKPSFLGGGEDISSLSLNLLGVGRRGSEVSELPREEAGRGAGSLPQGCRPGAMKVPRWDVCLLSRQLSLVAAFVITEISISCENQTQP